MSGAGAEVGQAVDVKNGNPLSLIARNNHGRSEFRHKLYRLVELLKQQLTLLYRLSERTGFDLVDASGRVVDLRPDEVLQLAQNSRVKRIQVRQGVVWLTGTPAAGDILLKPGESFALGDNWPYVVQAMSDTSIIVHQ